MRTYAPLRFADLADGLIVFLIFLFQLLAMGIVFPITPLPHQKFDKLFERKLKKQNRSFASGRRSARLHVAMQHRFVASDSRLQNRKKPDSDKGKFCDEITIWAL